MAATGVDLTTLITTATTHPLYSGAAAVAVLIAAALAVRAVVGRLVADRPADDVLTVVAALIATGVAMTGMWAFFGDVLQVSGPLRAGLFAFLEVAVVTSAVRARRNVRDLGTAGVDGAAVWVITGLSAVLSATDAPSVRAALLRLAAPLVAAWLWERGMAVERRRATGRTGRIHWRLTPERLLVRVGLAEPTDRTAGQVDAHRRITRLAKAAKRARVLTQTGDKPRRQKRALARLDRTLSAAVEHAGLADDPASRDLLMAQLAVLYNGAALVDLTAPVPWEPAENRTAQAGRTVRTNDPARTDSGTRTRRTGEAPRSRTGPAHTDRTVRAADGSGSDVDRAAVVQELSAEFLAAVAAGSKWQPDYPALMRATGRRRSWCEKVVHDARRAALEAHSPADPYEPAHSGTKADAVAAARTDGPADPRTGSPANVVRLPRTNPDTAADTSA